MPETTTEESSRTSRGAPLYSAEERKRVRDVLLFIKDELGWDQQGGISRFCDIGRSYLSHVMKNRLKQVKTGRRTRQNLDVLAEAIRNGEVSRGMPWEEAQELLKDKIAFKQPPREKEMPASEQEEAPVTDAPNLDELLAETKRARETQAQTNELLQLLVGSVKQLVEVLSKSAEAEEAPVVETAAEPEQPELEAPPPARDLSETRRAIDRHIAGGFRPPTMLRAVETT